MSKVQEAQALMQVHKIINMSWQTLKQLIPLSLSGKLESQEQWSQVLKSCESLSKTGTTAAAQTLARDLAIAIYRYLDNVRQEKATKAPRQRDSRPA